MSSLPFMLLIALTPFKIISKERVYYMKLLFCFVPLDYGSRCGIRGRYIGHTFNNPRNFVSLWCVI